uniref:Uncharacterized protein n=1 Tax=Ochrobactrum phage ORM_20 TaxID=2985243 RepID=A0A9N6WZC2_9VIRU|nr:hypothetical protein ORM20_00036 [Ochrobactrum phage ORM_20]
MKANVIISAISENSGKKVYVQMKDGEYGFLDANYKEINDRDQAHLFVLSDAHLIMDQIDENSEKCNEGDGDMWISDWKIEIADWISNKETESE